MFPNSIKRVLLLGLLVAYPLHRAEALLNFENSHTQVFVFGNVSFGYNSNIFSDSTQRGDSSITGEVGADFNRNAGLITVNGSAKLSYQRFITYTDQNALDPNFSIEFAKSTGRMTGSFSASVFRESRSDSAVNLRTNSWNIPLDLKLRYPVSERFYGTSDTGYLRRTYTDGDPELHSYHDYDEALDLFYIYTSKLDLLAGYRIRYSQATDGPDTYDHWFNLGATGAILAKLNGTVRFGYEIRDIDRGESFDHFNVLAALNWTVTRKLTLSSQISRDFNTIATGASVDSTVLALRANYAFTRKWEAEGGIAYGRNLFLTGSDQSRRDDFFSTDLGVHYKFNDHFRLAVSYTYLQNWSTLSFSDFNRNGFSVSLSSRF
ncbi:MAG: outer membrane beta-barrel protein [Lacunisphaera sp.]